MVIRQSPQGGSSLLPGAEATLIVGRRAVIMPEEELEGEEIEAGDAQ